LHAGARRRLTKIIAAIYRLRLEIDICDKGWRVVSRHRLRLRERTGAISLRIIHGILSRENQHTRLSCKANGLIADGVAVASTNLPLIEA